jgi:hypothetical protein
MDSMRSRAWLAAAVASAGLALSLVPSSTVVGAESAGGGGPPSKRILKEQLQGLERRLDDLIRLAKQDERMRRIERYMSWNKQEDFAGRRAGDPNVKEFVGYVRDLTVPMEIREAAKKALLWMQARGLDGDIALSEGRRRATFSKQALVPILVDAKTDDYARQTAAEVLDSLWHYGDVDVKKYNPRDPRTWNPARNAWLKYLNDK